MNLKKKDRRLYESIHRWARRNIEKPNLCSRCHRELPLELSNNSRLYSLDIRDWEWICHKCHGEKDHWSLGRVLSEEHKRKIGLANSIALKGNIPWNKNKGGYLVGPSSEEKKFKISQANKGQVPWNKGKKVGSYSRERMEKLWNARRGKGSWNKGLKTGLRPKSAFTSGHVPWNKKVL